MKSLKYVFLLICSCVVVSAFATDDPQEELSSRQVAVGDSIFVELLGEPSAELSQKLGHPKIENIIVLPLVGVVEGIGSDGTLEISAAYQSKLYATRELAEEDRVRWITLQIKSNTEELNKFPNVRSDSALNPLERYIGKKGYAALQSTTPIIRIASLAQIEYKIWRLDKELAK